MTADSFSTQNILNKAFRIGIGGFLLWLIVEVALWAAFRAPTTPQNVVRLNNQIPGLQQKVSISFDQDLQLRALNWSQAERDPRSVRILCVGGLATHAQLQNSSDTWWGQLAAQLQAKLPGVKIEIGTHAGVVPTSLVAARWLATFAKDFQPDLVITNLGATDVLGQPLEGYKYDANAFATLPVMKRERAGWKNLLLSFSQLARWKQANNMKAEAARFEQAVGGDNFFTEHFQQRRKEFAKFSPIPNPFRLSDADPRNEYLDALKIIHTQVKDVGAKLIITGEPCLCTENMSEEAEALRCTFMLKSAGQSMAVRVQSSWVERELRRFQELAQKYAEDNQLVFVETNGAVPQDATNFVNETMLTDAGAKALADLLLPKVLPVVQQLIKK